MNFFKQPTYYTKIFRDFKEIETGEHREVVQFYEIHEDDIRALDFEQYFEILVTFVDSLFQLGKYQKHLLMVDVAIEASVMNNVKIYQDADIYQSLLFQKAASCYHTFDLNKSEHILRELLKINPRDDMSNLFLKKCLRRKRGAFISTTRAISIVLFMTTALVMCIDLLYIRNFLKSWHPYMVFIEEILFGCGILALAGGELIHRWRINREVNKFVQLFKRIKG